MSQVVLPIRSGNAKPEERRAEERPDALRDKGQAQGAQGLHLHGHPELQEVHRAPQKATGEIHVGLGTA